MSDDERCSMCRSQFAFGEPACFSRRGFVCTSCAERERTRPGRAADDIQEVRNVSGVVGYVRRGTSAVDIDTLRRDCDSLAVFVENLDDLLSAPGHGRPIDDSFRGEVRRAAEAVEAFAKRIALTASILSDSPGWGRR